MVQYRELLGVTLAAINMNNLHAFLCDLNLISGVSRLMVIVSTYSFFQPVIKIIISIALVIGSIVSEIAEIFLISNLVGLYAHFTCILMCAYQSRRLNWRHRFKLFSHISALE